jgi:hypothetical protein
VDLVKISLSENVDGVTLTISYGTPFACHVPTVKIKVDTIVTVLIKPVLNVTLNV